MIIDTHFHAFPGKYLDLMANNSTGSAGGREYRRFITGLTFDGGCRAGKNPHIDAL